MSTPIQSVPHPVPAFRLPGRDSLDVLLARTVDGDLDAFARLYTAIAGPVYGLARRVLRDAVQAEDVCQDTLVEVWRTAARFDPAQGSARTWIMTLAHRRAVDRVRAVRASMEREHRAGLLAYAVPYDEVAEEVERREDYAQVRRCMDGLSVRQRESVTMAYYGGFSYPEVAELLGLALGTVKSRMRDGLYRLRDCLQAAA
ncbi:hypothetical protein N566_24020 [Streptomycetaceae bacterium MP113-05]|nr:hypothetical protein N566_24020 [Streptomycetaceae bacterium MP113-05]